MWYIRQKEVKMLLEGNEELDFLKLGTMEITDCLREELMVELGRESAQIL